MERVNEIKEILWRVENDPIFEAAVEREDYFEYYLTRNLSELGIERKQFNVWVARTKRIYKN